MRPTLLPDRLAMANVNDVYNGVCVVGDVVGTTLYIGRGAGRDATASAVIGDIGDAISVLSGSRRPLIADEAPPILAGDEGLAIAPDRHVTGCYYLRLTVRDEPGVLAQVASVMAANHVSIASVLQRESGLPNSASLILTTHETNESAIQETIVGLKGTPERARRADAAAHRRFRRTELSQHGTHRPEIWRHIASVTSIASSNVARRIKATRDQGHQVIAVVSARAGVTNELIAKARALNPYPNERELDMLMAIGEQETCALTAMALHALGVTATAHTGAQAGILTESMHTRARIVRSTRSTSRRASAGATSSSSPDFRASMRVATSPRLAAAPPTSPPSRSPARSRRTSARSTPMSTASTPPIPRVVPEARKLAEISYDEMLELASLGSKVMQSRSVEFAKKFGVVFEVRSSFNDNPGTIVKEEVTSMEDVVVRGVAVDKNQAKVIVSSIADRPGSAAHVFQALAKAGVNGRHDRAERRPQRRRQPHVHGAAG